MGVGIRYLVNADARFREAEGVIEILTVDELGKGVVKNHVKSADVLYGRPLVADSYPT